jgi:hypothetical protein
MGVRDALPSVRSGHSEQLYLSSCGLKNISHRDFQLALLRTMLAMTVHELRLETCRETTDCFSNTGTLDTSFKKHWPDPSKPMSCVQCERCDNRHVCAISSV